MMRIEIIEESSYTYAIKMLADLHDYVVKDKKNEVIILTYHPETITMGRRAETDEVLIDRNARLFKDIGLFFSPRGGGVTFHYPGQEVVYPVISLEKRGLSVNRYIKILAESAQIVLNDLNIHAKWDSKRPGLYVRGQKIASIGLRIYRGVTSHGMSINILPDKDGFSLIHPCKTPGLKVTSIQELTGVIPEKWHVAQAVAEILVSKIG